MCLAWAGRSVTDIQGTAGKGEEPTRFGWSTGCTWCYEGEHRGIETKQALEVYRVLTRLLERNTSQRAYSGRAEQQQQAWGLKEKRTVYVDYW